MNNVELISRQLERLGVRWVFGVPSGPVLPLIEALRTSNVQFVLTASESSAGFMATVVGQLTDAPGVCVATVGPGATNLATGVGAAWLDRSPVLAFTCNVPTSWLERRIQMRIDHQALFRPLSKASFALNSENLADALAEAISTACAEPPGPVHLDLPEDVGLAPATAPRAVPAGAPLPALSAESERTLTRELARAKRPLVVTGLTFTRSQARAELLQFLDRQRLPFVTTLHAKGFLPESHPGWGGVIGRARRSDVRAFTDRADLILAIGYDEIESNYEEWVSPEVPILHLSTERGDIGLEMNVPLNEGCDLDAAIRLLDELPLGQYDWQATELQAHRQRLAQNLRPPSASLAPHQVLDRLRLKLPGDGILTYDVGAHTHQIAAQWQTDQPFTCLATNGWSSMGFGMPAAYAAKLVHPERRVVGVVGDGGFQMTVGELSLARRLNLAVPIVVLNDGWLGLMKVKQERRELALSGVHLGPRMPPPAHYFGVPCRAANDLAELDAALEWALNLDGPSVVEAFVEVESYSQTVFD